MEIEGEPVPEDEPDIRQTSAITRRLLVPLIVLAGLGAFVLYVLPGETDRLFAWTLTPEPSATFMGAGFTAGVLLSVLSCRRQPWAVTRTATATILLYVLVMTITTFLHLDRMHFDSEFATARAAAWIWVVVYTVVTPLLGLLLVLQARSPGVDPPRSAPLPALLRGALLVQGVGMLVLGIVMFLAPESVDAIWPWPITALSGRALSAWIIALGFAEVWVTVENDLARVRPAALTFTVLGVLWFVAVLRGWDDFRWDRLSAAPTRTPRPGSPWR